ncbi:hypothetical protein FOXG_20062 [Fusarium oxysporum f. sp. lycopersici 4287]|uniref:Uncharacterized protein n=2 Tax=Fusarium oxysporum TaxID=5507 RepID=A0A0J9WPC6_FUSO4|nr:hypothetical protein FOXG_20062 [Fusarium oxysporum f. sp. lycopersici 4287]EXK37764.1 hypothetical protein FOMG_08365 [Fusarium oxysporum f. sp. melonis 26406]KNB08797.1 hypothetical protein FOXG_20062 [Fusarium oxysporum f. sp. lycopersici 4287]
MSTSSSNLVNPTVTFIAVDEILYLDSSIPSHLVQDTLMAVTCFSAIECWSSKGQKRSVDTPRSKVQYMKLISKLSLASQDVQRWTGNIRIPENSQSSEMRASAVAHGWELWTGLARKCQNSQTPHTRC